MMRNGNKTLDEISEKMVISAPTYEDPNYIITPERLADALVGRIGAEYKDAIKTAHYLTDIFGFEDMVIDTGMENDDRQLFYLLQQEGLVRTGQMEIALYNGNLWRTHYWKWKKNEIRKAGNEEIQRLVRRPLSEEEETRKIYEQLETDGIWISVT